MGIMEIILLVLGAAVFVVSFLLPAGKKEAIQDTAISEDTIREMVGKEVEEAKTKISDIVDETVTYSMEKAERSMDRLTNEKMMAVNEYSDTVLAEINKSHKEVVFLYDMMNDKQENLKAVVSEATKTADEVKQTMKDAEVTAKEIENKTKEVMQTIDEMAESSAKNKKAEKIAEPILEEDVFEPIEIKAIEVVKAPEESTAKAGKSKTTGKTARKPRSSKTTKKDVKEDNKGTASEDTAVISKNITPADVSTEAPSGTSVEVPEVAVALNEEGKTGSRNSNERILELHKAGKSNMAIARELGLGIGEVKLVIDLFEGM